MNRAAPGVQIGGPHHLTTGGHAQHHRDQLEQGRLVVGDPLGQQHASRRVDDDAMVRPLARVDPCPHRCHLTPSRRDYRRVLLERQPRRHVLTQRSVRASLNKRSSHQQGRRAAIPSEPSPTTTAAVRQRDLSHTRLPQGERSGPYDGPNLTHPCNVRKVTSSPAAAGCPRSARSSAGAVATSS